MDDSFNTEVSGDAQALEIESLEVFQDWIILEAQALEFANAARAYRDIAAATPAPPSRTADELMPELQARASEHAAAAEAYRAIAAATRSPSVRAPHSLLAGLRKAARGHAAKARHYRRRYPVASQAAKAANPARKSARAVHSHVSHGGARASSGDDGDGGDGPPRPHAAAAPGLDPGGGNALNPDNGAPEILALHTFTLAVAA